MSASTSSYSNMLNNLWAPEGSDMNERLKRLQELEKLRKEREAKRKAMISDSGTDVPTARTSRMNSSDPDTETSSRLGIRRTLSLREDEDNDSDNFGGARPKMAGYSSLGQEERKQGDNMFSGAISDMLTSIGIRKPLRGARDYQSNNDNFRSYIKSEDEIKKKFLDFKSSLFDKPKYDSKPYASRQVSEQSDSENRGNGENYDDEHSNNVFENGDHDDNHIEDNEEDHGEEPKHFIERLKYGNGAAQTETPNYGSKHIQSIPTIPPFRQRTLKNRSKENPNQEMPELVQPQEDILSVAQEISTTFGSFKSPTSLSPSRKYFNKEEEHPEPAEDLDASVAYEIVEVDHDSSGDERGKLLSVNDSFYKADLDNWDALNQTPGKLDKMQEFFTGIAGGEDPNISRELDGGKVKAELDKSFSKPKTPKSDRRSGRKTPTGLKKSTKKEAKVPRSKSPLDRLKSSESENDSAHTSENETDPQLLKYTTPKQTNSYSNAKKSDKNGMSLTDKLAKLELLTQEKKRKQSFSENETKKPVPSYMSETNASQKKKARAKDMSPKPAARDLKKDVRELKQFVHQHTSEPNTPVTSPIKLFNENEFPEIGRRNAREVSVQTEFVIDFPDINYVCKHCGKSSFEEVASPLTKENVNKTLEKKAKRESPDSEKTKFSGNRISSKESVASLGEVSTKSERSYRYKPKAASGAHSYMKGTTSSRLKTDPKGRKGSAPDIVHLAEVESANSTTSLKGLVSQKTKAIESASKKEKNKPSLSVFRGSSVERDRFKSRQKGQLTKSKSFDQVNVIKNEVPKPVETETKVTESKTIQKESSQVNSTPNPREKKTHIQMEQKATSPTKADLLVEKLDLSSLVSPRSQVSPRSPVSLKKPPLSSPRGKDAQISPRSETFEVVDDATSVVESKGQFTTIDDNPFIKNDVKRRNSFRDHEKSESVWEKAESRSRSTSVSEADKERRQGSASSLKRHNSSAGEKSSVSELTWSDSGSNGSLRGSKSSLHGSNNSLNREGRSAFSRPRSVSTSSGTSQTSAMLNLLSPIGTSRHPVSGAMETDVDIAYNDHVREIPFISKAEEHNEESVNRAHLEFAKKACDLLEFEPKKRDSSNESDHDRNKVEGCEENNNNYKNVNGGDSHSLVNGTESAVIKQPEQVTPKQSAQAYQPGSHGNHVDVTVKGQSSSQASGASGIHGNNDKDNEEELVVDTRVKFKEWDPSKLLAKLYEVKMMPDNIEDISHKFIGMEGLMEKLPMNKKKATLLKTWKRRFFRAKDGWLHYYESGGKDKPSDSLQLMGGKVEELGPRVLGVDDGRGKYLMVRVPTDHEYGLWKVALESQTADNVKATYVRPAPASIPHPKKKVIIIDIGSSCIRAGILGERATLPQVFFPSIVAVHKKTGEIIVGANALKPEVRKSSTVTQPIQPTNKVDKFNIDMAVMNAILKKVFTDLGVSPTQYLVMLSTPQNLGDKLREGLMRILVDEMRVQGVCMVQQALLALYSYNAMSGIIVDIGERLEILPIYDGLLIEGGVSRQAYGGAKIQDSLHISLLENRYQFSSFVEKLLVRYICEQVCYVTDNYKETKERCDADADKFTRVVDCTEFDLPDGAYETVKLDYACFKSPEGFFNTDLWEMDYKNIQKQIYAAIQQCPMDSRKQMYRSIYLSGGVTTSPGFAERLQEEMRKLAPPAAMVEVHASPQRYHAAYIGACAVASMDVFQLSCVSADEWKKMGVKACKKWGTG